MDLRIEIPADYAARNHDQHREQRKAAVQRADLKIGVQDDEGWPEDTEHHVNSEPRRDPAQAVKNPESLAERIKDQEQHRYASCNAEPIADS